MKEHGFPNSKLTVIEREIGLKLKKKEIKYIGNVFVNAGKKLLLILNPYEMEILYHVDVYIK